jgi:hypothetical protein
MLSANKRFILSSVIFIVVALMFVFGGSALTVMASQSALPGDRLYPIKTSLEQTRTSLSRDSADRAELYIEFAGKRLQELEQLIAEGRFLHVTPATLEFEMHIQNALLEIDALSTQDPDRAGQLLQQITQSLIRYSNALSIMVDDVPDSVRAEMIRALRASRRAGGIENENMNSNANLNENLNENQNVNENANLNANQNANQNSNQNENLNANLNLNTNESQNVPPIATLAPAPPPTATSQPPQRWITNDNDNYNDNGNDNGNDNYNDNGNDNDD